MILSPICLLPVSLIQEVSLFQHDGAYEDDEGRPSDVWRQKAALPVPENWKDGAEVFTEL